mmetsp:Transcript_39756/g.64558  ORF Transcript_39756/g.64558 Transcript_39756/m.64558 type:complete len:132 (-) Transcript_39756:1488-1883(-)
MMGGIREILDELDQNQDVVVAVASSCDEPAWAREAMRKMVVNKHRKRMFSDIVSVCEIHKSSKSVHLQNISQETGISFEDMVFFDDQMYNLKAVSKLGVACYHVPNKGITHDAWKKMVQTFRTHRGKIVRA